MKKKQSEKKTRVENEKDDSKRLPFVGFRADEETIAALALLQRAVQPGVIMSQSVAIRNAIKEAAARLSRAPAAIALSSDGD